ncbi:hypothetical protein KAR91_77555 [Candidatus Pacearchaeota archaeon]|nr:hypothetical protein [Candidatus Pacearchaeota archaeon]
MKKQRVEIIAETKVDGKPLKVGHKGSFDSKTAATLVNNHKGKYIDIEVNPKAETAGADTERAEASEAKVAELEDEVKVQTERADTSEAEVAELKKTLAKKDKK